MKKTLVIDAITLQKAIDEVEGYKMNPMERVMATNLLSNERQFYIQYRIDVPDEWIIMGKKYFIADFYIPEELLIIETEGKIHYRKENLRYDQARHNTLTALGFYVFHFDWSDVMENSGSLTTDDFIEELSMNNDYENYRWWTMGRKFGEKRGWARGIKVTRITAMRVTNDPSIGGKIINGLGQTVLELKPED